MSLPRQVWVEFWRRRDRDEWEIRDAFERRKDADISASIDSGLHPDMEIEVVKFVAASREEK